MVASHESTSPEAATARLRVDRLPKDISHPLKANLTTRPGFAVRSKAVLEDSNLVDPASSHMLVSKTKPCMSKYKCYTVKLRMAH